MAHWLENGILTTLMRMNNMTDDYTRGTGRILVGMICIFSAFVNFFSIANSDDVFINLLMFVVGVCFTFWGYVAEKNSEY